MRARTRWLAAFSLAATLVAGCGDATAPGTSPDPGAKVGGKPGPIAITVADSQPNNKPSNLPLAEFERQVETLSGGSMTVTILARAVDDVAPGSDAAVIDRLKAGTFQLAVVPARAWSEAGVASLKALQAPFLFESDEHVDAVVDDAAITNELFTGLGGSGVTGLTLFPESLRHLFSFGAPMLTPTDVKGKTIRAISSLETTAIIEALGGMAVDPAGDGYQQGIDNGTIHGTDSGFTLALGGMPSSSSTATGNVALYAKVMTLVVNSALWAGLDDVQRAIITKASDATRAWAIANQVTDASAAAKFCAGGGTVVLADPGGIAAFRAAEASVYAAIEADPAAKRAIDAIEDLKPASSSAAVAACEPAIDATTLVPDGGDLPNGIYRVGFTDAYLTAKGVTDLNEEHGVWTFRLQDGHWTMDQVADNPLRNPHLSGEYQVVGGDIFWTIRNDVNPVTDHLLWSVDGRGDLSFTFRPGVETNWWFGLPWVRVGDLAAEEGDGQAALDGIYRYEVTEQYLLAKGLETSQARDESGVHTLTMSHGKFTDAWVNGVADDSCSGTYAVEGRTVTLRWTFGCTGDTRATYERDGDVLRWSQVESLPPNDTEYDQKVNDAFWGVPYTRIGDAP